MPQLSFSGRSQVFLPATCLVLTLSIGILQADEKVAAQAPRLLPQPLKPPTEVQPRVRAASHRDAKAEKRVRVISPGTSSRAAQAAGQAALPLNKLTAENRERVEKLLESSSAFRELPTLAFEVQPAVYRYFLSHPDAAVSIWRAMKISKFQMFQTGPVTYEADAADGTLGVVDVLLRDEIDSLVICNGEYRSPLLAGPIKANALMHLQTEFGTWENGKSYAKHRLTMFVDFPSLTVETAAKVISPVSNYIVDRNFQEVSVFLYMMSLAMTRRPDWVEQIAGKMDGVLEPSRAELIDLTTELYSQTQAPHPGATASPAAATAPATAPQRTATQIQPGVIR